MLATRGMGPGPTLPTAGLGPLFSFEPGFTFPVPQEDVTFVPRTGTVSFKVDNLDFTFEVRNMQHGFKVPPGDVTFHVTGNVKMFVVPPGALGKVFKPQ